MTEQTLEAPLGARRADAEPAQSRPLQTALNLVRRYPWAAVAVVLLAISTVIVVWARTRPGYDPYGWLVWGKLTLHWNLDTNGAPSWKPLPYLFTLPYAVVGHYALWLWMISSVAVSLSGVIFAWRIAFRLTDAPPERAYAAYAAGLFAAAALLGIRDYSHFILSSQSDTMIVSLCLGAIDCWLSGRQRWAFWLWILAALGRPEVWPFLGMYTLWAWWTFPGMRRMIYCGLALLPLLWFGIPALTAKSAFIAGSNALHSPRELKNNKFFGTIDRFLDLHEAPVQLAALAGIGLAFIRRQRLTLIIAGGAVLWVLVEAAFALHGWPAVPRYLFEAVGAMCVVAGIGVGRAILELPPLLTRFVPRIPVRGLRGRSPQIAGWATGLVVLALAASMAPSARQRLHTERVDLTHERARTKEFGRLSAVVSHLGSSRIMACGQPNIPIAYQSVLAWYMNVKIGVLYYSPGFEKAHPHTTVDIYPLSNGWKVVPRHLSAATPAQLVACRHLTYTYRS